MSMTAANSQYSAAIDAANLADSSGLYVILPRWSGRKLLVKMGLTKNVTTRFYSSYRHSMPYAAGSFELLAFMRVGESQLKEREAVLLRETIGGFGFEKPVDDLEWRIFKGSRAELDQALIKLFAHIRTTVDGNYYTFHPTNGQITRKGGRKPSVQLSNVLPPVPNVETRAAHLAGMRKTPGVLVMGPYGQMVPLDPHTNRRLRNITPANRPKYK